MSRPRPPKSLHKHCCEKHRGMSSTSARESVRTLELIEHSQVAHGMLQQHLLGGVKISVPHDVAGHCPQQLQLDNAAPVRRAKLSATEARSEGENRTRVWCLTNCEGCALQVRIFSDDLVEHFDRNRNPEPPQLGLAHNSVACTHDQTPLTRGLLARLCTGLLWRTNKRVPRRRCRHRRPRQGVFRTATCQEALHEY